jgi:hypothetical protein
MSSGLYTQPQFPPTPPPQFPPSPPQYLTPPRSSGGNWVLSLVMIGGGFLILLSVLIVAAVWYAVSSLKSWVVDVGREGVVAMVEESQIPNHEKTEVIEQVDRVVAAYKAGQIDEAKLEQLLTMLDDSPAFAYITFAGMEEDYLADTDLPPAEQDALRLHYRRALYGLTDEQISLEQFEASFPDGYDEPTDETVREWTRELATLCDEAGVTRDPPEVDVGDEMKKLVDELLAK